MTDNAGAGDLKAATPTIHLLHRVQQLASDRFTQLAGENELTLRQYVVMAALAEQPGATQIELVRATGIDRSTLADMVVRLERRTWISRKPSDTDGRVNLVRLTEAGLKALTDARQAAAAADAVIIDALPRTKRKTFLNVLKRLSELVDKEARKQEREGKKKLKRESREREKQRKKARVEKATASAKAAKADKRPSRKRKGRAKARES